MEARPSPPCDAPDKPIIEEMYKAAAMRCARPALLSVQSHRAFSVPIESGTGLQILDLTRFLYANRYPLRLKTL
jgi:hypothetical protein